LQFTFLMSRLFEARLNFCPVRLLQYILSLLMLFLKGKDHYGFDLKMGKMKNGL